MLARRCGCPVVVDANRVAAVQYLLEKNDCDLIISDDGLQHYALGRDMEIAVIDGARGLGNGQFLPAGPLRESPQRLGEVDWIIVNGDGFRCVEDTQLMQLRASQLMYLPTPLIIGSGILLRFYALSCVISCIHAVVGAVVPSTHENSTIFKRTHKVGYFL